MGLKSKIFSGVFYVSLLDIINRCLGVASAIIGARMLSPDVFGIYALVFIVFKLVVSFNSPGLFASIINNKDFQTKECLDVAWTYERLVINILLSALVFFIAPIAGKFYNQEQIINIIRTLSIVPLISIFLNTYETRLQIDLKFKRLFFVRFWQHLIPSILTIILIVKLKSIWAFVIPELIKIPIKIITIYYYDRNIPSINFSFTLFKKMFVFGRWILLTRSLEILKSSIDKLVIGKIVPISDLGYFQFAGKFSNQILGSFNSLSGKLLFPIYSYAKNKNNNVNNLSLIVLQSTLFIFIPISILLISFSEEIISFLFGIEWLKINTIFMVLSISMLVKVVVYTTNSYLKGTGIPKYEFFTDFGYILISVPLIIGLTIKYSIVGAAFGVLIADVIIFFIQLFLVTRHNSDFAKDFIRSVILILTLYFILISSFVIIFNLHFLSILLQCFLSFFIIIAFAVIIYLYHKPTNKGRYSILLFESLINLIQKKIGR